MMDGFVYGVAISFPYIFVEGGIFAGIRFVNFNGNNHAVNLNKKFRAPLKNDFEREKVLLFLTKKGF